MPKNLTQQGQEEGRALSHVLHQSDLDVGDYVEILKMADERKIPWAIETVRYIRSQVSERLAEKSGGPEGNNRKYE